MPAACRVFLTACLQALASCANHLWYFPPSFCMETSCHGCTKADSTRTSTGGVRASQAAYSIGSVPPEAGVQETRIRQARSSEFSGIRRQRLGDEDALDALMLISPTLCLWRLGRAVDFRERGNKLGDLPGGLPALGI